MRRARCRCFVISNLHANCRGRKLRQLYTGRRSRLAGGLHRQNEIYCAILCPMFASRERHMRRVGPMDRRRRPIFTHSRGGPITGSGKVYSLCSASQTVNPCIAYETYEERNKEALVSILIKINPFKSPKFQKIKGKTLLSKN